ncbi:MAG: hypothetical protein Q8T13_00300 [Acidobacteriota bacterium]|nr:hypothetical protein [Acidobacteriota bacterium]
MCAVVPAAWLVLAGITQQAMGRYSPFDPDYYYLLSSLDLAESKSLGLFQHPGTPAAILGAAVMTGEQLLTGSGEGVQADVLNHPERYLALLRIWSAILIALGLAAVGVVTLRATRSPWLALLLQLSVFMSPVVVNDSVGRFKPEPVLLFACLLFVAVMVAAVRSPNPSSRWFTIAFGLACGLGLATKFTFASVTIVPFLLARGWKQKAEVIAWTLLAFFLFTLPIADRYDDLLMWTQTNLTHTGLYGSGEPGFVETDSYLAGVAALARGNALFGAVLIIALAAIALVATKDRQSQDFRALCALTVSLIVGFALVTKHGSFADANRYLFCSYCLLGLTLWLSVTTYTRLSFATPAVRYLVPAAVLAVAASVITVMPPSLSAHINRLHAAKASQLDRDSKLAVLEEGTWKNYVRIYDLGTQRTPLNGLFQASYYSTSHLEALGRTFPTTYFCDSGNCTADNWKTKHIVGLDHQAITPTELIARHGAHIVMIYGHTPTIEAVK